MNKTPLLAKTNRQIGVEVAAEAAPYTIDGLIGAILSVAPASAGELAS